MLSAVFVVKSELRQFEKTRNRVHLAHAQRALQELMDETNPGFGESPRQQAGIGVVPSRTLLER
jgi:hypothetical protein